MPEIANTPFIEGRDIHKEKAKDVFNNLVNCAAETFATSSFIRGGVVTSSDLALCRKFYTEAAVISPSVFNLSTQKHLNMVGKYARLIGEYYNKNGFNLNLDLLETLGLFHDVGRTFSHRRGRNNLIGDLLLKKAGFTPEFMRLLPSDKTWTPVVRGVGQIDPDATFIKISQGVKDIKNHPLRLIFVLAT